MSTSETADDYSLVVATISATERIIRCKHDLQFILQRREAGNSRWPWKAVWFFATKAGAARLKGDARAAALALFATAETPAFGAGEAAEALGGIEVADERTPLPGALQHASQASSGLRPLQETAA